MHSWLKDNFDYISDLIANNRLPNCIIVTGNKLIGKDDLVRSVSQLYLGKENLELKDNPNFVTIVCEEGSKAIKIDQIRDVLDNIYLKSEKRVVFIQDGHKLNINASNALLKIIEEPPLGTKFFITTSKIQSIIPTILSRSSIIKCNNPNTDDIDKYFTELEKIDLDNYYVLSNLNSNYIKNNTLKESFSIINDFFSEIDRFISSEENIIDVSKKFSAYNIEQLINVILFTIINFQKSDILKNKTRFYEDNNNFLKNYDTNKLFFIYDKLVNIKKNINIIQNNETILFSICILFKKTAKSN